MSKNFDQEYKDLMEQEVPDLWNRIEPALHEKKFPPVETNIDLPRKIVKFPMGKIMKYTGALAACICLVILIPTFLSETKKDMQYQDNSQSEMSYDYESETVTEATEGSIQESTEEATDETSINDEMKAGETAEENQLDMDQTVFQGVQVYIVAIKQPSEGVFSYQVEVVNVDHDIFTEGLEIIIHTETQEMKKGRTYTVSIIGDIPNEQEKSEYSLIEITE